MKNADFVYFASRARKQSVMALHSTSPVAADLHMQLASRYAGKAALAMNRLMEPRIELPE
jgi:hypothetical protein